MTDQLDRPTRPPATTLPPIMRSNGTVLPRDYPRCGAPRRSDDEKPQSDGHYGKKGQPCERNAGWGTDHPGVGYCRSHGGTSKAPSVVKFNARMMADAKARRENARFGMHVEIGPSQALLAMVHEAAGNVATLGGLIDEMNERARVEDQDRRRGEAIGSDDEAKPKSDDDEFVADIGMYGTMTPDLVGAARAMVGPLLSANAKSGAVYKTAEETRALVQLYGDWTDRLVKYSKAALDAGVAKAQVEIAKKQAETLVTIVRRVLGSLNLSAEVYQAANMLMAAELRKVASVRIINPDMAQIEAYATSQKSPDPSAVMRARKGVAAARRAELPDAAR